MPFRNSGLKYYYKKYRGNKKNEQNFEDKNFKFGNGTEDGSNWFREKKLRCRNEEKYNYQKITKGNKKKVGHKYLHPKIYDNYNEEYLINDYDRNVKCRKKSNVKHGQPYKNNKHNDSEIPLFQMKNYNVIQYNDKKNIKISQKINMKALEKAGFVHLYGLSPVLYALSEGRRLITDFNNKLNRSDEIVSEKKYVLSNFVTPQTQGYSRHIFSPILFHPIYLIYY
jgi:hypothetical protein